MNEKECLMLARWMLRAPIMDQYDILSDYIDPLDVEDAKQLGVVFANGKNYNYHSDIRGDEIDDGKAFLLAKALKWAIEKKGKL